MMRRATTATGKEQRNLYDPSSLEMRAPATRHAACLRRNRRTLPATTQRMPNMECNGPMKFVTFLAMKQRLAALQPGVEEYVTTLCATQNIVPVMVSSAREMTEALSGLVA